MSHIKSVRLPRLVAIQLLLTAAACCAFSCTAVAPDLPATLTTQAPPVSPAPSPSPAATPTPEWAVYASATFSVTLRYPAAWRADDSAAGDLWRGADGFVRLTSAYDVAETIEGACASLLQNSEATGKAGNQSWGSHPQLEYLRVDNQPACLILPAADEQQAHDEALLLVQYPRAYERNRILQLWADLRHLRPIAASVRFSPPPQALASLQNTPAFVELDIFSGLPNPIWSLPDAARKELLTRLARLASRPTTPYPGLLGYRGLLVHFNLPPYGMPETVEVFQGAVCYDLGGTRTCQVDAGRKIERWLLATADKSQVDGKLLEQVLSEMDSGK